MPGMEEAAVAARALRGGCYALACPAGPDAAGVFSRASQQTKPPETFSKKYDINIGPMKLINAP